MSELAESNISVVNDVFIKQIHFVTKGRVAVTHAHRYDHQTLLATGSLLMTVGTETVRYEAPAILVVKAGVPHRLEALEDQTVVYCIHAITGGEGIDDADPLVEGQRNDELANLA